MSIWTEERMEELLPVVTKLVQKYTGGMSTSVTYEKAQELMEAVLYCIHEYEQEQSLCLLPVSDTGGIPAEKIYQRGYELVIRKVKKMRAFYNHLMKNFCSYGCRNYADVMEKGMPEFFRRYDPGVAPQNTILTLDYPTLLSMDGLAGIDAIEQYLSYISLEQKFMRAFDERYVCRCLKAYDWNYQEQFFNLCGVLLEDVLLCILMHKPLQSPVCPEHRTALERWRTEHSASGLEEELRRILERLTEERFGGNELLYEYLCGGITDLASRILEGCLPGSDVFV